MKEKMKLVDGDMYEYTLYDRVDQYSDVLGQNLAPFDFANPPMDPDRKSTRLNSSHT